MKFPRFSMKNSQDFQSTILFLLFKTDSYLCRVLDTAVFPPVCGRYDKEMYNN